MTQQEPNRPYHLNKQPIKPEMDANKIPIHTDDQVHIGPINAPMLQHAFIVFLTSCIYWYYLSSSGLNIPPYVFEILF